VNSLTIAVVVLGLVIAYLLARIPQRVAHVLDQQDAKRARAKELESLLAQLCEHTERTRVILERAAQRPAFDLASDEIDDLRFIGTFCEASLPGLTKTNPMLDRYFNNHLAVVRYVLGESDPDAAQGDRISNALESIYRFFAAQMSNDPIAVMERRLATGYSI
jgi:hypothetical protein